tara:strand:+ start:2254 stop:2868 length:615 start_codon:yes stop_codon:yes gene_type:complete
LNATVRHGSPTDNAVYLTFDDGPDPVYTPRILYALDRQGARACFFVLGSACRRHPNLLREVSAAGHDIGVHGMSHDHPWLQSSRRARAQVADATATVAEILGERPRFFRPAYGRRRQATLGEARKQGLTTVLWSRSAMDWGRWGSADRIIHRLHRTRPGDILLLHDGRPAHNRCEATCRVLPGFLQWLASHSLACASLTRLDRQ